MQTNVAVAEDSADLTCSACHSRLAGAQDRVATPEGVFCHSCHRNLRSGRDRSVLEQGRDVNYPMALLGAMLGGAAGALAWWCVTVWTKTAFGAVAILIGIAVGKCATLGAGHKRSRGLQILSLTVAGCSYFYAAFLVNRTFIQQALAKEGKEMALGLLPDPAVLFRVVALNFGAMDFLFLAIVLWEAWKLAEPEKLPGRAA